MILICYDGSDDAKAAILHAAELSPGSAATVLVVWEAFSEIASAGHSRFTPLATITDLEETDEKLRAGAGELADEGVEIARGAGLDAKPATVKQETSVANAIVAVAAELNVAAIVMGSRGIGSLASIVLGSVSQRVLQHADRPVLVIPSAAVAARRHKLLDHPEEATA